MRVLFTTKPDGKWHPLNTGYTILDIKGVLKTPLLRDGLVSVTGFLMHSIWLEDSKEIWTIDSMEWKPVETDKDFNTVWEATLNE